MSMVRISICSSLMIGARHSSLATRLDHFHARELWIVERLARVEAPDAIERGKIGVAKVGRLDVIRILAAFRVVEANRAAAAVRH